MNNTQDSMCSELFPKEFEKTTEVLPFPNYGLSSIQEFREAEKDVQKQEWLLKAGLTQEDIILYREHESGLDGYRHKIETNALQDKLKAIYDKIHKLASNVESSEDEYPQPGTSNNTFETPHQRMEKPPLNFYPVGHPMNNIKQMEQTLFNHLKNDDMLPINKRRKMLRHLERKKHRILALENQINIGTAKNISKVDRPGSLWDVKEIPQRPKEVLEKIPFIGPKKATMYSIKDNKIVRLEPISKDTNEFKAVDILTPVNEAEKELLEGTKMSIEDIKKMERFKDFKPGIPSKTLYLKNIAPPVSQEQLSLLYRQFTLANGGPVDVRLMTGRMRGQAFVTFNSIDTAIQALQETNGTILSGRPIIAQFGRNNNKTDLDN